MQPVASQIIVLGPAAFRACLTARAQPQPAQRVGFDTIYRLEQVCQRVGPEPGHGGLQGAIHPTVPPVSNGPDQGKHIPVTDAPTGDIFRVEDAR